MSEGTGTRALVWAGFILGSLGVLSAPGCNHGYSKQECNERAQRSLVGYAGLAESLIADDRAGGNVDPVREMETRSYFTALSVLEWYSCVESAETDHVNPAIPFAPVWEQAEFKL